MPDVTLPPNAVPLRLAVPAFWDLELKDQQPKKYEPHWQAVIQAGSAVSITVIEGSWPQTAANNATWKQQAQDRLAALPGTVLGYVSTRVSPVGPLRSQAEISQAIKAWYDQFGQQIDGIYFDELVLPERSGETKDALSIVSKFKTQHPGAKTMILAGQCPDERVVGQNVDWALLWEDTEAQYRQAFAARVGANLQPIPSWWKDPAYRRKIVHVVHDCPEPSRQRALGLANERNAGNVFVMDQRGLNPKTNKYELYDHLPPYWSVEVREANSYYDFGFDPERVLLAAYRYGLKQGKLHTWPNFEAAWYPYGHVRGTFFLDKPPNPADPYAEQRDVARDNLPGKPPLFDIPAVWRAADKYAKDRGYETALPTFERVGNNALRLILFKKNLPWLAKAQAPVASTYQQPHFAEPGSVIRNVNRWAASNGYKASFPTFVPDDPANNPSDRTTNYDCYVLNNAAPVTWQDVPTSTYIQQL